MLLLVELGVVIGRRGSNIKEENAYNHVAGYALALDLTARHVQATAKSAGLPWSQAKGYDTFCPIRLATLVSKFSTMFL